MSEGPRIGLNKNTPDVGADWRKFLQLEKKFHRVVRTWPADYDDISSLMSELNNAFLRVTEGLFALAETSEEKKP